MRRLLFVLLAALCAACQSQSATPIVATLPPTQTAVVLATAVPTTAVPPTATFTPTPTPSPTLTLTPTLTPSLTFTPTDTLTPSATFTPSPTPPLPKIDHYVFQRPFPRTVVDYIDRTYPYGMGETRGLQIHHGVDYANGRFTSIQAIGSGTVYYAGGDQTRLFGPFADYYGTLVVIEHDIRSPDGQRVYSLYGHMEDFDVETGDRVSAGQVIGRVGGDGVAFGPHLHLEIRLSEPESFLATVNPDLWIYPWPEFGTIAGRVVDADGTTPHELTVSVRRAGLTGGLARYTFTYADDPGINSDPVWDENFVLGDLAVDEYEVFVSERSGRVRFRQTVTVENGKTTWVDITLRP